MMQLVARVARKSFVAGEDRNFVCACVCRAFLKKKLDGLMKV
jgi:hypothetical protein